MVGIAVPTIMLSSIASSIAIIRRDQHHPHAARLWLGCVARAAPRGLPAASRD